MLSLTIIFRVSIVVIPSVLISLFSEEIFSGYSWVSWVCVFCLLVLPANMGWFDMGIDKKVSFKDKIVSFKKNIKNSEALILCVSVIVAILAFAVFRRWGGNEVYIEGEKVTKWALNEFGDFFGGLLGPIFSLLTLFYVIKQNQEVRNWEERRERREDERDLLDITKIDLEIFSKEIEFLEKKFHDLKYQGKTGEQAFKAYEKRDYSSLHGLKPINSAKKLKPEEVVTVVVDLLNFEYELIKFIKGFNSLVLSFLMDAHYAQINGVSSHVYLRAVRKYSLYINMFDENKLVCIWGGAKHLSNESKLNCSSHANAINSMFGYVFKNKLEYPRNDIKALSEIYSKAEKFSEREDL